MPYDADALLRTLEALQAFLFGVAVAAPLGPIALLLIRAGLNHRVRTALDGALGVALADFTYALMALSAGSGLARLLHSYQLEFQLASSGMLVLLGLYLAAGALRKPALTDPATHSRTRAPGLVQFYLLTLANPLTILLFAGFSGRMVVAGGARTVLQGSLFLFLGSLMVQVSYATFGAALQRWFRVPGSVRAFNALSGLAIASFGLFGLWRVG